MMPVYLKWADFALPSLILCSGHAPAIYLFVVPMPRSPPYARHACTVANSDVLSDGGSLTEVDGVYELT